MAMSHGGLTKLVEEASEVIQVASKKIAMMQSHGDSWEHWDGQDLKKRLTEELGDLHAALNFVVDKFNLSRAEIVERSAYKRHLYNKWDKDPNE